MVGVGRRLGGLVTKPLRLGRVARSLGLRFGFEDIVLPGSARLLAAGRAVKVSERGQLSNGGVGARTADNRLRKETLLNLRGFDWVLVFWGYAHFFLASLHKPVQYCCWTRHQVDCIRVILSGFGRRVFGLRAGPELIEWPGRAE